MILVYNEKKTFEKILYKAVQLQYIDIFSRPYDALEP